MEFEEKSLLCSVLQLQSSEQNKKFWEYSLFR